MLQLKLAEKRGELVPQSDVDELIETLAGVTLTKLPLRAARRSGDPARYRAMRDRNSPRDRNRLQPVGRRTRRAALGRLVAQSPMNFR